MPGASPESPLRYHVRADLPYAEELRKFVEARGYESPPRAVTIPTTNRRNRLSTFPFNTADVRLVLKVSAVDPELSAWRQAGLWLSSRLKDHSRAAYEGALALERAGIPTGRPVAYGRASGARFFLYEEAPADCSLRAYRQAVTDAPSPARAALYNRLVSATADLARRMHAAGLRHGALEVGNVLVDFGGGGIPAGEAEFRLHLIDTDRVSRARVGGIVKRVLDLRDLRRLDFDEEGRAYFLRRYLGTDDVGPWLSLLNLFRLENFRLRKWLRRRKRPKYKKLEPREGTAEIP